MDTPRTPRDIAQLLTATIREGARGGDLAAVGAAATAAAILDLADAIREGIATDNEPDTHYRATCPADGCVLLDGHDGDHSPTAPPIRDVLADMGYANRTDEGPAPDEPLLCLAEGHTPRGNRVVCAEPAGHPGHHIAGGYQWWDDGRPATSTLPPGYVAKMPDVVGDSPVVCGYPGANGTCRREPGHSGLHHDEYGGVYMTGQIVDSVAPPAPVEPLGAQVDRLARWIVDNVTGEPSQSEGAIDTAIRVITKLQSERDQARDDAETERASRETLYNTAKKLSEAIVHTVEVVEELREAREAAQ